MPKFSVHALPDMVLGVGQNKNGILQKAYQLSYSNQSPIALVKAINCLQTVVYFMHEGENCCMATRPH